MGQPALKTDTQIKVRHPEIDYSGLRRNYFHNSAFFSALNTSLSLIFPDGERFFIRSVKHFQDQIQDPKLLKEIKAFIGQEVAHGQAHEEFNNAIAATGVKTEGFLEWYRKMAFEYIEPAALKAFGPKMALSVTVALEHYTASLAHNAFTHPELFGELDPEIQKLLLWHAAEEIEHKSVAFDVLDQVDDNYFLRVSGMLIATGMLWGFAAVGTNMILRQSGDYNPLESIKGMITMMTNRGSMIETGITSFFGYFRPGFHPEDIEDRDLAQNKLAELGLA